MTRIYTRGGDRGALERVLGRSRQDLRRYAEHHCVINDVEDVVDALAQAERVGVHSMMHSSWDDSGELPPWNSTGDAARDGRHAQLPALVHERHR